MSAYINGKDFMELNAQKYWAFPSSYDRSKREAQFKLLLNSRDYVASEKKDGYWQMIVKDDDGNVYMRARQKGVNGWVCKQDWVPHLKPFFDSLPNGTCLICEIYLPGKTSKAITSILGCKVEKAIQRQEEGEKLHLSVFDILAWDGRVLIDYPMVDRLFFLDKVPSSEYVHVVEYWIEPEDIRNRWLEILENGGEGIVMTRKDNPYEQGKRTARHTLKLKKELSDTLDVFLTGQYKTPTKEYNGKNIDTWLYWYNEVTEQRVYGDMSTRVNNEELTPVTHFWYNHWAAAVEIAIIINGRVTPIGWISGIPDEIREEIVKNPDKYKGKVVELQAMEIDNTGKTPTLRHAKIIRWRDDKSWKECIYNGE